tara:strand:+ start:320 stop:463 length:144 start_codon:yes stop_codon:yes gene_type:complete
MTDTKIALTDPVNYFRSNVAGTDAVYDAAVTATPPALAICCPRKRSI